MPEQPADGDALGSVRATMVEQQIAARGVRNRRVLEAMKAVPRHEFVPPQHLGEAYEDEPLPIGHGQTISQPYIVAFMTELIDPQPGHRVLEIGTGSGYQAAVLSKLAGEVYSIEIVEALAKSATDVLARLGYKNVKVRSGDGFQGWPEAAPFDTIIVTCAPENLPAPLVAQLKEGGKMVIPVGELGAQQLYLLEKKAGKVEPQAVLPVRFVPMTGTASEGKR